MAGQDRTGRARGRAANRAADQPGPGVLPRARLDEARPRQLLPRGRRRDRAGAARAARACCTGSRTGWPGEKVHQKRLPAGAPAVGRDRPGVLPALRPHRRRAVRHRAGRGASGPCRWPRSSSTRGTRAAPTWSVPTSGGSTSTRCPTPASSASAGSAGGRPRGARRARHRAASRRPPAATGCTSTSGSCPSGASSEVRRAALAFAREVERRAARRRDHHVVAQGPRPRGTSSSTTTRTPATTPSPAPGRCAACPDGTVSTPFAWDELDDDRAARASPWPPCPARFAKLGDPHAGDRRRGPPPGHAAGVGRPRRAAGVAPAAVPTPKWTTGGRARRATAPGRRPVGGRGCGSTPAGRAHRG